MSDFIRKYAVIVCQISHYVGLKNVIFFKIFLSSIIKCIFKGVFEQINFSFIMSPHSRVALIAIVSSNSPPTIRSDRIPYHSRYPFWPLTALLPAPYPKSASSRPFANFTSVSCPICSISPIYTSPIWPVLPGAECAGSKAKTRRPSYQVANIVNAGHHFDRKRFLCCNDN